MSNKIDPNKRPSITVQYIVSEYARSVYNKYIPNTSDCCLNLPSKMRKKYIKSYDKYSGKLPSKRNIIRDSNIKKLYIIKDNDGNINVDFFNDAQEECWKLIASDSMLHFKTTDVYKHAMYQE
mmetsp:Transcript_60522/g.74170  ORF Transcript_60522/g.74170 Transcript_60522/m.74170 type:complete len:123 (+) Transcript_60522:293-661(+)